MHPLWFVTVGRPHNGIIIYRVPLGQATSQLCQRTGINNARHRLWLSTGTTTTTISFHIHYTTSTTSSTRHRASTSMYSLTFCVRFLLRERHQRKPAVQAASNVKNAPSTANHRRASHAHFPYTARNFENAPRRPPVSGQQHAQTPPSRPFALCRPVISLVTRVHVMLP